MVIIFLNTLYMGNIYKKQQYVVVLLEKSPKVWKYWKKLEKMLDFAIEYNGPIAIRYPRDGFIESLNDDNKKINDS